jgi:hypothetical protein
MRFTSVPFPIIQPAKEKDLAFLQGLAKGNVAEEATDPVFRVNYAVFGMKGFKASVIGAAASFIQSA